MAMNIGQSKDVMSDMNVTPMIDVLLVLIIVFMVIKTATNTRGLEALAPHPPEKTGDMPRDRTVVVEIHDQVGVDRPALTINTEPVTWERLRDRLIEIYKLRAERVLFVTAGKSVDFEEVATVIDTAHGAFADMKIGLIPR